MLYFNNKSNKKTWQEEEQTVATATPHPDTTTTTNTIAIAHLKWIEYVVWN